MTKPLTKPNRLVTEAEQQALLKLPLHQPAEIQGYLKPGEGLQRVAPATIAVLLANDAEGAIAKALKIDPAHMTELLQQAAHLAQQETALEKLYRHAYENRLEAESDVYRKLLKLNRFVQNSDDAELQRAFAGLSEWVAGNHESTAKTTDATATAKTSTTG